MHRGGVIPAAQFLPNGRVPEVGSILAQRDLARSLRIVIEEGADALYAGTLAQRLAEFALSDGGLITQQDLVNHSSTWQEPVSTDYYGLKVVELPPNSQGIALLMQLNVAEQLDLRAMKHNSADYIHSLVEIKKRVFIERDRFVSDPAFFDVPLEQMLSPEQTRAMLRDIRATARNEPAEERSGNGDTVLLCALDKNGNAVVLIQSLFASFGSGRMVPGTGIVLHNRGSLFSLDPSSVNVIAPNKRPYHTLAPGMVLRSDNLYMVFGSPGSDGQTQTMIQVLNNIAMFGMTPQEAVDAPRYRSYPDGTLLLDAGIDARVRAQLTQRGHRVKVQEAASAELGGAQVILLLPSGALMVGADHRREAHGIAW